MSKKPGNQPQDGHTIENIEEVLTKSEQFIEQNKNTLLLVIAVIFVLVGGFIGFRRFVIEPKEQTAQSEMFMAERYFQLDSFRLALEGDGQYAGFEEIIEDYGITKSAKLAHYYAGISYLYLGEYEEAINYLKKFKAKDKLVSVVATGAIGDAYSELEEYNKAVGYYEEAAKTNPNDLTSAIYLKKAGLVYEQLEDYSKALEAYNKIKLNFPNSDEARDIEKFIAGAEVRI